MSHYGYGHNLIEFTKKIEISERLNLRDDLPPFQEIITINIDPILKSINCSNITSENIKYSQRKKLILNYNIKQKITYLSKNSCELFIYENSFIFTCSFILPKRIHDCPLDNLLKNNEYNITTHVKELDFKIISEKSILKNINLLIKLKF